MKKVLEILRLIVYYAAVFVFSSIAWTSMPIGAIAMVSAVYASGGILAPVILLSGISVGVFVGVKSILILIVFLILFLIPVIFIRPLVSIEGRNEKRKVGNYVLFAGFFSFVFFGFLNGIYALILTYLLYKVFVNTMAILRNEDEKLVFSKEESIGLFTFLSVILIYISSYFALPILYPVILIAGILGYAAIKRGVLEAIGSYIFIFFIYVFLIAPVMKIPIDFVFNFNNVLLLVLPIVVLGVVSILRNFKKLIIYLIMNVLNISLFFLFYMYFQNLVYYLPYLLMSFAVVIFADDYQRKKDKKLRDSYLITDEGETRLEQEVASILKEETKKEPLKSREIIELFSDKDLFVNRMYLDEEMYKELTLYSEIQSSDYIIEELYDLINEDGYIDRLKFNNILVNNNVVIDIYSYEMEEEIRILEILALREIKNIVREREEKKVIAEREEGLQYDNKVLKDMEEMNSIAYNIEIRNNVKNKSIRKLNKDLETDIKNKVDDNIDSMDNDKNNKNEISIAPKEEDINE